MKKLHFKYATMNSGKSIDLIRTAHNYEENGYQVLIIKPSIDTKGQNFIESRIGLKRKVDLMLDKNDQILNKVDLKNIDCILVDESQFLTRDQVDELYLITKKYNISVICYGLRVNFKMESFEGSRRLLEISEVLEEITTLCKCGNIARYVGRQVDGKYVSDGEEVVIDGSKASVKYIPLCGTCYLKEVKKNL